MTMLERYYTIKELLVNHYWTPQHSFETINILFQKYMKELNDEYFEGILDIKTFGINSVQSAPKKDYGVKVDDRNYTNNDKFEEYLKDKYELIHIKKKIRNIYGNV